MLLSCTGRKESTKKGIKGVQYDRSLLPCFSFILHRDPWPFPKTECLAVDAKRVTGLRVNEFLPSPQNGLLVVRPPHRAISTYPCPSASFRVMACSDSGICLTRQICPTAASLLPHLPLDLSFSCRVRRFLQIHTCQSTLMTRVRSF